MVIMMMMMMMNQVSSSFTIQAGHVFLMLLSVVMKMPLWGMLVSSTYGIVALTFERFLAVVYPIWHKTKFSRSKVIVSLVPF